MSETSERAVMSAAEKRGGKDYWRREGLRLAGEVAALEAKLEAALKDSDRLAVLLAQANNTMAAQDAKLEAMEELKEAIEAFKADDTWKFDPAHIGRGLMTWGEVLTALAAAQQEQEDE